MFGRTTKLREWAWRFRKGRDAYFRPNIYDFPQLDLPKDHTSNYITNETQVVCFGSEPFQTLPCVLYIYIIDKGKHISTMA